MQFILIHSKHLVKNKCHNQVRKEKNKKKLQVQAKLIVLQSKEIEN